MYVWINVCLADISRAVDIYQGWHLALSSATKLISQTPNISTISLPPIPYFTQYSALASLCLPPLSGFVVVSYLPPSIFFFSFSSCVCVDFVRTWIFPHFLSHFHSFLPFFRSPADSCWRLLLLINTYTLSLTHTQTHTRTHNKRQSEQEEKLQRKSREVKDGRMEGASKQCWLWLVE